MKILILGNKGFVGRNFQKYFLSKGDDVWGMDIKDGQDMDCRKFFRENTDVFDLCIHAAAIVGGIVNQQEHPLMIAEDFSTDAEFFQWAIKTKQKKLIVFSSLAAYPDYLQKDGRLMKEDDIDLNDIRSPWNVYGWTKIMLELQVKEVRKQGIDVYVFRPASGYGWDQDDTYPFPSLIKRVIMKQDPFEVWGEFKGEQVRDFIHIDDVIGSVLKCVNLDIQEPINLGSGIQMSFNQLTEKIFEVSNWRPKEFKYLLDKPAGSFYRAPDVNKMMKFYIPKVSIEQGIKEALDKLK